MSMELTPPTSSSPPPTREGPPPAREGSQPSQVHGMTVPTRPPFDRPSTLSDELEWTFVGMENVKYNHDSERSVSIPTRKYDERELGLFCTKRVYRTRVTGALRAMCCCGCCYMGRDANSLSNSQIKHLTMGVVPRTGFQFLCEVAYTCLYFVNLILHVVKAFSHRRVEAVTAGGEYRRTNNTAGEYDACAEFNDAHTLTSGSSELDIAGTVTLVLMVLFALAIFSRGNADFDIVAPIIQTLSVVVMLWSAVALMVVDIWTSPQILSLAFTLATLVEIVLVLFLDAAVNLSWWFQVFHVNALVSLLAFNLFLTVFFGAIDDTLLMCLFGEAYSSNQLKRIIYVNLITSLLPGAKVTCCDRKRVSIRFAESPLLRSDHASQISEGNAQNVLQHLQLRAQTIRQRRSHVEHLLFKHEPGTRTVLNSRHEQPQRSAHVSALVGFSASVASSAESGFPSGLRRVSSERKVPRDEGFPSDDLKHTVSM